MTQDEEIDECVVMRMQWCMWIGDEDVPTIDILLLEKRIAAFPQEVFHKASVVILFDFNPELN